MEQTEFILFVIILNAVFLLLAGSVIYFLLQYRKRKSRFDGEKMQMEKQHKLDLLHMQVDTQQQVMNFIGRELHDHVAQRLTLASLYAKMATSGHAASSTDPLHQIAVILDSSLLELRDLTKTLTNDAWQQMNLAALIRHECELVNSTGICSAHFESNADPALSIEQKNNLLRIVQEFIQNTLKHANASTILIVMTQDDQGLHLALSDNGSGFDLSKNSETGAGLENMKRRMLQIGGHFQLASAQGTGTTTTLTLPLV